MPLQTLDAVTGALLIGTWANSFLYMAEFMEAKYYFTHFKHDHWKLKTLVAIAFFVDTVSTLGDYYTITHAHDPNYLTVQNWLIPLYLFTTAVIAVLVQSFLVVRYWWFTRNILVTLVIFFLILVAVRRYLSSFRRLNACGVIIAMVPAFSERKKVRTPATIWLVTEAVADLGVAAALLWEFRKAKRNLGETSVLDRLVALTIRTGQRRPRLRFLLEEETNISVGIAYTLGRVYVLSMLANLNVRKSGRSATVANRGVSSVPGCTLTFTSIGIDDLHSSCSTILAYPSDCSTGQVDIGPRQDFPAVTLKGSSHVLADHKDHVEMEMTGKYSSSSGTQSDGTRSGLFSV
ncbi:hypothetical protein B0H13DRAFT_2029463, partial [Mycena leptocephala]